MEKPKNYKAAKHSGYEIFRIFRIQRNARDDLSRYKTI